MIITNNGDLSIQNLQADQVNRIEIVSDTKTTYAFGLNQSFSFSPPTPLFIAQISSNEIKTMTPLMESVLLIFSQKTPPIQTSTIVDAAFDPGILISVSGTETNCELTYDKDKGWGPADEPLIKPIYGEDDLKGIYNDLSRWPVGGDYRQL